MSLHPAAKEVVEAMSMDMRSGAMGPSKIRAEAEYDRTWATGMVVLWTEDQPVRITQRDALSLAKQLIDGALSAEGVGQ